MPARVPGSAWLPSPPADTLLMHTRVQAAALLMPAGLVSCFRPLTPASLFLILYGAFAVYFSGVMVHPVVLCLGCVPCMCKLPWCGCTPHAIAALRLLLPVPAA